MIKMFCPYCDSFQDSEIVTRNDYISDCGHGKRYIGVHYICYECTRIFDTVLSMELNMAKAREAPASDSDSQNE